MRRTASQPAPARKSYEGLKAVVAAPDIADLLSAMGSREELQKHTQRALKTADKFGWKPWNNNNNNKNNDNENNNDEQNNNTPEEKETDETARNSPKTTGTDESNESPVYSIEEMLRLKKDQAEVIEKVFGDDKKKMIEHLMTFGTTTNTTNATMSSSPSSNMSISRTMMRGTPQQHQQQRNEIDGNNHPLFSSPSPPPTSSSSHHHSHHHHHSNNSHHSNNASIELAQRAAQMFGGNTNSSSGLSSPPPPHQQQQQHDNLPVFGTNIINNNIGTTASSSTTSLPPRKKYFQTGKFHQKILALLNKVSDDEGKFSEIKNELLQLNWSSIASPTEENASEMRMVCSHFLDKACLEKKFVKHYARLAECIVSSQELKEQQIQLIMNDTTDSTDDDNKNKEKNTSGEDHVGEEKKKKEGTPTTSLMSIGSFFREQLLTRCERSFIGYFEKELEIESEKRRQRELKGGDDDNENENHDDEYDQYERDAQKKKMIGVVRFAAELYLCGVIRPSVIQTILVSLCAPIDLYLDKQEGKEIPPAPQIHELQQQYDNNNQQAMKMMTGTTNNENNNNASYTISPPPYHLSDAQCDAIHVLFESCGESFAMTDVGMNQGVPQTLYWAELESLSHPKARARFLMMNVRDLLYPFVAPPPPPPPPDPTLTYDDDNANIDYSHDYQQQQQQQHHQYDNHGHTGGPSSYVPPHLRSNQQQSSHIHQHQHQEQTSYDDDDGGHQQQQQQATTTDNSQTHHQDHLNHQQQQKKQPFSREKLHHTMCLVSEHNAFDTALQSIAEQFDPTQFLIMWLKRLLTINKCRQDRLLFPKLFAMCVEQGVISRPQARLVVMKNIDYIIDEQLWEDVPNLWENWAMVIAAGTRESFVWVKRIEEEYLLNFDEDVATVDVINASGKKDDDAAADDEKNKNQQSETHQPNAAGLYTSSTLLLHPAWHNHLLARILALPTSLYSIMGGNSGGAGSSTPSSPTEGDQEESTINNNNDNSTNTADYESRNNIMTIARRMIEGVVKHDHETRHHNNPSPSSSDSSSSSSMWNTPVFLWRSPNGAPPRIAAPRFRFLAVLCKFASMNELHVFVRSVVEASAVLRSCSFEAQFFLSLVDGVRPNLNTVLGRHPHLASPIMPMIVCGSVVAACVTQKNEKYRSVPDWLLAAVDGKNRGMREALCLYEIASSGCWIGHQTNYLSWGYRFVSFLREVRVVSDDVVEAVRSALNSSLLLSISTTTNSSSSSPSTTNQQHHRHQHHHATTMLSQVDAMLGPQLPSQLRKIQSQAVKTIKMKQMRRIQQELV